VNEDGYEFHPCANFFPLLEGEEFQSLVDDIRENGLLQPGMMYEGKILEGRNRYRACRVADVEFRFEQYTGDDPLGYVVSLNIKRRHLTTEQRAMLAAKLENLGHGGPRGQYANLHVAPMTRERTAALCNVSVRSVADARVVVDQADPEFRERVEAGGIAIDNAALIVKHVSPEKQRKLAKADNEDVRKAGSKLKKHLDHIREMDEIRSQSLLIPEGRFNVIVIDPPWDLPKVGPGLEARDEAPGLPYPTMSIDQIREWGQEHFFPDIRTAFDCHLFLWCPDHFLWDARALLQQVGLRVFADVRLAQEHGAVLSGDAWVQRRVRAARPPWFAKVRQHCRRRVHHLFQRREPRAQPKARRVLRDDPQGDAGGDAG
jgi:hypothetical protein